MLGHIGSRLLQLAVVIVFLTMLAFVLMKLAPGDPVLAILKADEGAVSQADQEAVRSELGFDLPLYEQYGRWLHGIVRLDLGESYINGREVRDILAERLPATLQLTAGALIVLLAISFPLGWLAAAHRGRLPDYVSRLVALLGASMPSFWFGLLLIYLFSFRLGLLPTMGQGGAEHLILPSVTLGFVMAPEYIRLLRSGLLDALSKEYITAARARGIAEWRVMAKHALRTALLPLTTLFGMSLGSLLAGSVVTESLFAWPGLGSMALEAIAQRNYPVVQGYILLVGVFVALSNLLADIGYGLLDPRIRLGKAGRP